MQKLSDFDVGDGIRRELAREGNFSLENMEYVDYYFAMVRNRLRYLPAVGESEEGNRTWKRADYLRKNLG